MESSIRERRLAQQKKKRNKAEVLGRTIITAHLDDTTFGILEKLCEVKQFGPATGRSNGSGKVEVISNALTYLLRKHTSEDVLKPKSKLSVELVRLHETIAYLLGRKGTLVNTTVNRLNKYKYPKSILVAGGLCKDGSKRWTKKDVRSISNPEELAIKIKKLNKKPAPTSN